MAVALQIVYTVIDRQGERSTMTAQVASSTSLNNATEAAQGLAPLLDALTQGIIESADICLDVDISGLTNQVVDASSDVEELAAFQFLTADGRPVNVNVPSVAAGTRITGTLDLDQTDADVSAFITFMEDGYTTLEGPVSPSDIFGDDIVDTRYARERHRNSGKRRR